MPFCKRCGSFEPLLNPNDICEYCFFTLKSRGNISKKIDSDLRGLQSKINYPALSYIHDIIPNQSLPNNVNQNIFSIMGVDTRRQMLRTTRIRGGHGTMGRGDQNPVGVDGFQHPTTFRTYMKSNIALILAIFSLLTPPILSLIIAILSIILVIMAKRDEPPSWRQLVVVFLCFFSILFNFIFLLFGDQIDEILNSAAAEMQ